MTTLRLPPKRYYDAESHDGGIRASLRSSFADGSDEVTAVNARVRMVSRRFRSFVAEKT